MAKFKVTLIHSPIGESPSQRQTVRGLGFRNRHETVELEDTPTNRGMIEAIEHLVEVERVEE